MLLALAVMKTLEAPDIHHLRAASGWLMLGNYAEANEDLERISPHLRVHPDVLEVRWQIYAKAEKWSACAEIANAVVRLDPNRTSGWIDRAYSLRRGINGGPKAAFDSLLPAVEKFPAEPLIPFNLSCYACQVGQMQDACKWLRRAFAVAAQSGHKKRFKLMALEEPDLGPLWRAIGELIK